MHNPIKRKQFTKIGHTYTLLTLSKAETKVHLSVCQSDKKIRVHYAKSYWRQTPTYLKAHSAHSFALLLHDYPLLLHLFLWDNKDSLTTKYWQRTKTNNIFSTIIDRKRYNSDESNNSSKNNLNKQTPNKV